MKNRNISLIILAATLFSSFIIQESVFASNLPDPIVTEVTETVSESTVNLKQFYENPLTQAKATIDEQREKTIYEKKEWVAKRKKNNELKNSAITQAELNYAKIEEKNKQLQTAYAGHPDYTPAQEKAEHSKNIKISADAVINQIRELKSETTNSMISNDQLQFMQDLSSQINSLQQGIDTIDPSINYFNGYYDISDLRKNMVTAAVSLVGKISYSWGEKPDQAGWDEKWNNGQSGLDCSGFVQWVYWTASGDEGPRENLGSTLMITHSFSEISKEELLPGDIGTMITDGSYYVDQFDTKYYSEADAAAGSIAAGGDGSYKSITNHVGIYIGKDAAGNMLWCHCMGSPSNTVVVTSEAEFGKFIHYYRITDD